MRPYVVYDVPWRHWVGGARALHYLCHALNRAGCEAYIATDKVSGYLDTPVIAPGDIPRLGRFVAVYPERISGNPYGAPAVARWLLHRPDFFGRAATYSEHEHTFAWSNLIQPPGAALLWVPTVEEELFNTDHEYERKGVCYYVGKGKGICEEGIDLSYTNVPTREGLAEILKRSEWLYSFDNFTLLFWEAGLCGCPSVLIPTGEFAREEFAASEYGLAGIAWGYEEMERARATVDERPVLYADMVRRAKDELLPAFIEKTQKGVVA